MAAKAYAVDLPAPDPAGLLLPRMIRALDVWPRRNVLVRLLSDSAEEQGLREHPPSAFDQVVRSGHTTCHLHELRYAGWVHQRPGRNGLLTRLRYDDVEARFPRVFEALQRWFDDLRVEPNVGLGWDEERRRFDRAFRQILNR